MSVFRLPFRRNFVIFSGIKQATVLSTHTRCIHQASSQSESDVDDDGDPNMHLVLGNGQLAWNWMSSDAILASFLIARGISTSAWTDQAKLVRQYDRFQHFPHMSLLKLPGKQPAIPLAIMKGRPFHETFNQVPQGFDAQKDIWITKGAERLDWEPDRWEPPTAGSDLLALQESRMYQKYCLTFDFVNDNPQLGAKKHRKHPTDVDSRISYETEQKFFKYIGINADPDLLVGILCSKLLQSFTYAQSTAWKNGGGRSAMNDILTAAVIVCRSHAFSIGKAFPVINSTSLGGSAENNAGGNVQFASKKVVTIDEQELRNTEMWMEPKDQGKKEKAPVDSTTYWAYSYKTPDGFLSVFERAPKDNSNTCSPIGMIVGEVRSDDNYKAGEIQAFTQALQGLYFSPFSAALFIAPEFAIFQSIRVENGFVHTEKKDYFQYSSFKTMFSDLVLYLWDSYFKDFKR